MGARQKKKNDENGDPSKHKKKKAKVSLLLSKRSLQVSLILSRMKLCDPVIKTAIMMLNNTILTEDVTTALLSILPTRAELDLIKGHDSPDDLAKAERFFYEVKDIRCLKPRLQYFNFTLQFKEFFTDIDNMLLTLEQTQKAIMESENLKGILQIILGFGNRLNHGKGKKKNGFKLITLTRIRGFKANVVPMTLMHFLVETIENNFPKYMEFLKDLEIVPTATRIESSYVQKKIMELSGTIKEIEEKVKIEKKENYDEEKDRFCPVMEHFLSVAKPQIESINERWTKFEANLEDIITLFHEDPKFTMDELADVFNIFLNGFKKAQED